MASAYFTFPVVQAVESLAALSDRASSHPSWLRVPVTLLTRLVSWAVSRLRAEEVGKMTPAIALALTDRLSAIDLRVLRVQEIVEELGQENSTTHHDLVVCRRLLAGIIDRLVVRSAGWSSETLAGLSAEGATPAHQSEDEFLGQVTPENTHPDLDANPPVGREQW